MKSKNELAKDRIKAINAAMKLFKCDREKAAKIVDDSLKLVKIFFKIRK